MARGRPCLICCDPEKFRVVGEMVVERATDQAIADRIGLPGNAGRMCAARHRVRHIEKPAKTIVMAANKGRDVQKHREKTVAAAKRGELDPKSFLSVGALAVELRRAADRLEKASDEAEQNGQLTALAQLVGQTHKNVEVRGKLAGVGGYALASTKVGVAIGGAGHMPFEPFVLTMHLSGRTETTVLGTEAAPPFEVRDARTGRPFDHNDSGAIVTKAGEPSPEIMVVPPGWQAPADYRPPMIERDEPDEALIERIARQAGAGQPPADGGDDEGDV